MSNFYNLPHVSAEEIKALSELLRDEITLHEKFRMLVLCGLEEYGNGLAGRHEVSEKIATCLLLVVKGEG